MKIIKLLLFTLILSLSPLSLAQSQIDVCRNYDKNATQKVYSVYCNAIEKKDSDACETIKDTEEFKTTSNQETLKEFNNLIDTCRKVIEQAETTAQILSQNNTSIQENFSGKSCLSTEQVPGCQYNENNSNETLILLNNILNNNFVYQLIDPISDENLIIQERVCTFDFLRERNGLYRNIVSGEPNSTIGVLIENQCYNAFVTECQPKLVLDRNREITDELPISRDCKTYQVIYGRSGTDFIQSFVSIIYRLAVGIIGVIAVLVMVINGIRISTAGDDSGVISDAKERIAQSIFGLAILFFAWIILRSVNPNFFTTNDVTITQPNTNQTTEQTEQTQP